MNNSHVIVAIARLHQNQFDSSEVLSRGTIGSDMHSAIILHDLDVIITAVPDDAQRVTVIEQRHGCTQVLAIFQSFNRKSPKASTPRTAGGAKVRTSKSIQPVLTE